MNNSRQTGFTLIEMLVIAPIALLVIGGLVAAMIAMTGNSIVANTRSATAYNIQDALSRIEQDARIATKFEASYTPAVSPLGKGGGTNPFSTTAGDLIITQQATTGSPYNVVRNVVYYANTPNACGTSGVTANNPLPVRSIYFLSSGKLWRRTVTSTWNLSSPANAATVCAKPWQRNSCPPGTVATICKAVDEAVLDNVSEFSVTYYTAGGASTSNATLASYVVVSLSVSQQVAGTDIYQNSQIRAFKTN